MWTRSRPVQWLEELWAFGLKQAWACIFGGALLALILATGLYYPNSAPLYRYDFLLLASIALQAGLLASKLETWHEARVILVFHLVATAMELFKTSPAIGSWSYPERAVFRIAGVPLFTGFMYSAVGSYIARAWRVLSLRYESYPAAPHTWAIAALVYVNFFTHHFVPDLRWALLFAMLALFWRTRVYFTPREREYSMPLMLGLGLVSLFIWIAENLATYSRAWSYPDQLEVWRPVGADKLVAWLLLMFVSFVLVSTLHRTNCAEAPSAVARTLA